MSDQIEPKFLDREMTGERKREVGAKTAGVASLMIFGRFVALFISGMAFIIVARALGPGVYGVYTLAVSFAGFFGAVTDFGVSTAIVKFISEHHAKGTEEQLHKLLSNGYMSVVLSGLLFTAIAFAMSSFIATHVLGSASLTYIIQIISFGIFGALLFNFSYNVLVGFGRGRYVAIAIIVQSVVQSALSIVLSIMGYGALGPIIGLLLGYLAATVAIITLLISKLKIRFVRPSFREIKRLIGFSSPISIYNGLRGLITNLSPIVLGIFATTVIVGNFGVALRTSTIISTATDALGLAVLPMFAYTASKTGLNKEIGRFYNYAAYITYLLVVPALLYLAILSKQFSYTIFSAKYLFAPLYISIISVGTLLWILASYTTMLLISTDRVKDMLRYGIAVACIEFVLLFALVPIFGGVGVTVLLFVVSPILIVSFMSMPVRDKLGVHLDVVKLLRVIVAGVISALFLLPLLFLLPNQYIAILVIGLIEQFIAYPIIVASTGAANKEDLESIKSITGRIPVIGYIIGRFADYSLRFARS